MIDSANGSVTLTIARRSDLEHLLDNAVAGLMGAAKQLQQGVVVTRLSPDMFNVSLSDGVPYGTTVENLSW